MNISTQPNLLLEGLAYLGRIANGNTWQHMEHRIRRRKITPSASFESTFTLLKTFSAELEKAVPKDEDSLMDLFANLEGFAHNTVGSSSPAFLLFYPMLEVYNGDTEELLFAMQELTADRAACHIASTLNLRDPSEEKDSFGEKDLIGHLLTLSIPDKSKITILEICHNCREYAKRAAKLLVPVVRYLETQTETIAELSEIFLSQVDQTGGRNYLENTSHLNFLEGQKYQIRPFLFGMDTILTSEASAGETSVYCGILRKELLSMLNEMGNSYDDVFEACHLLGDRTRFDILCYLCSHEAYGQELSEHFSLSRNTIHHHMNKLLGSGLVISRVDGNRNYYTVDKAAFSALIRHQEELFGISPYL